MRAKLGLMTSDDHDETLIKELLDCMHKQSADFTLTFRALSSLSAEKPQNGEHEAMIRGLFNAPEAFDAWALDWRARLARENSGDAVRQAAMLAVNPAFIPRNHRVEAAIAAAVRARGMRGRGVVIVGAPSAGAPGHVTGAVARRRRHRVAGAPDYPPGVTVSRYRAASATPVATAPPVEDPRRRRSACRCWGKY